MDDGDEAEVVELLLPAIGDGDLGRALQRIAVVQPNLANASVMRKPSR